ncbi:helix-turn-helix transcriptional regulator [Mariniplasma anaerobium]|uniref:Uncharacterized protein n=1 Tax=Mariniplasma anaerobium TaxID=2735436 RepID=A0A7U9XVC6_9MOLU|nr:helix-turn-helix transcriptional regulator [Mariniplasma anaerobium]BCR35146.1 hypothetical protein MPAN_000390 [Mariniplasma anaerobium]
MLNLEIISKKIIEKRKQIGMTQNELADALYVTRQAVSKWEMGKCLPSIDVLIEMTELFDVTIDYMLDGSDLRDNDYATMLMQFPREAVIYRFINSDNLNENIKNIFYLLTTKERKQMINQVLNGHLKLDTQMLWPYLSRAERKYLLGNMKSKDIDKNIENLYDMMSTEERLMMNMDWNHHVLKKTKKEKNK